MTTRADVDSLIAFLRTTFVDQDVVAGPPATKFDIARRPGGWPAAKADSTGTKGAALPPPTYFPSLLPMPNGIQTRQEIQNQLF